MADRILIVQRSSQRDGSAFSGLLLADGLREAGWLTHVAFGYEGPIIEEYRRAGHQVRVIPHNNWLRSANPLRFMRNTLQEIRSSGPMCGLIDEIRPQVVYVNTLVSVAGAIAAKRRQIPCLWHVREMFADVGGEMQAPARAMPIVRQMLIRLSALRVANSHAVAKNVLGQLATDVQIVPNAVHASFFSDVRSRSEARTALGLSAEGMVVGVPGTLRPMKGHPFLLRAIQSLLDRRDGVTVAVTGEGDSDYKRRLIDMVATMGAGDHVRFLGSVIDMPAFYRASDVVVVPSVSEPFGRTVIEAFAMGTPVVASAVGGILEIVEDGRTGLLVPYGDEQAMRTSIEILLDDPERAASLSSAANERARSVYHETSYKQRLVQAVAGVAAEA